MHVTNATPQMQAFNAPIWLALEDYALGHAREDEMQISVFTGPYFDDQDPKMYGVRIPLAFWKIIAFIHDETGKLCATGYEMNQENTLQPEEEFVFGAFTSPQLKIATQVSIRSIEARSGISFGRLASVDPLAGSEEGWATPGRGRRWKRWNRSGSCNLTANARWQSLTSRPFPLGKPWHWNWSACWRGCSGPNERRCHSPLRSKSMNSTSRPI